MKSSRVSRFSAASILAAAFMALNASNALGMLIVNGDFSADNTGFTSAYTYSPGNVTAAGSYTVDNNPRDSHGSFYSMFDHTVGTTDGKMLVVNGASQTGVTVWQGTSSQALVVGQQYDFSAWAASVYPDSPAQLVFSVSGITLGTPLTPTSDGSWMRFFSTFTALQAFPTFKLLNNNTASGGNDFAIDDIDIFVAGTTNNPTAGVPDNGPGMLAFLTLISLCGARSWGSLRKGLTK